MVCGKQRLNESTYDCLLNLSVIPSARRLNIGWILKAIYYFEMN
jgi:hypothetical protein